MTRRLLVVLLLSFAGLAAPAGAAVTVDRTNNSILRVNSNDDASLDIVIAHTDNPKEERVSIAGTNSVGQAAGSDCDTPDASTFECELLSGTSPRFDVVTGNGADTVTTVADIDCGFSNGFLRCLRFGFPLWVDAGGGADELTGDFFEDRLLGGPGNDRISGGFGNDVLDGGFGDDSIAGGFGNDTVTGGPNDDLLSGDAGSDTIKGGDNTDSLYDGGDNDTLEGEAANDRLFGDGGNDSLRGGDGLDTLQGGAGADVLEGGAGVDIADYSERTSPVTVTLDGALENDGEADEKDTLNGDIEDVIAGEGSDSVTGDGSANALFGLGGDDTITGGSGSDRIDAGDGNDTVNARDGVSERIDCGPGTDTAVTDAFDDPVSCETVQSSRELMPDVDADGSVAPADCNDADPNIRPGAPDPPLDGIDQDCANGDAPPEVLKASTTTLLRPLRKFTEVLAFSVLNVAAGAKVTTTCKARKKSRQKKHCPFKKKTEPIRAADANSISIARRFGKRRRVAVGAKVVITVTKDKFVGRHLQYEFRKNKPPKFRKRCLQPGETKPTKCPT